MRRLAVFLLALALLALACGSGDLAATVPPRLTASGPAVAPTAQPGIAIPTAIALPTATGQVETDITGRYHVIGTNTAGQTYEGEATIAKSGLGYRIEWTIGGASETGEGAFDGQRLSVRWQTADGARGGTADYDLQFDGSLTGTWTQDGLIGTGTETLTPLK